MATLIGKMRDRITIQQRTGSTDDYGHSPTAWADVVTCWAWVRAATGGERVRSLAAGAEVSHEVTVWHQDALAGVIQSAQWRIVWGTRVLAINSAREAQDLRRTLVYQCTEGMPNG